MNPSENIKYFDFKRLAKILDGEFRYDHLSKILYATDASAYRELPLALALPKSKADIGKLIQFAREHQTSLIPRGAGTSLAGQVVGHGIVVDISKYMNRILEVNADEKWVKVEPGVVLSELNLTLKPYGLMFGPETSTANRCTMGGMLGNNSCGLHSLVHGSVREHILEVEAILSDGSEVLFGALDHDEFQEKLQLKTLEGKLYRQINELLSVRANQTEIARQYPHPSVPRRNNGYALDMLLHMLPFDKNGEPFNFSKLLAGSEGTLAFTTSMKLNLIPLPPNEKALLCVHFNKLEDAFHANLTALKYHPSAIELMDKAILDQTRRNIALNRNRFFIDGDPAAILIIELWSNERDDIISRAAKIEEALRNKGLGYHFPLIWGADIPKVWALRTAGLGVLSNMPGDAKPVSVVEDTAIPVERLPQFLNEFRQLLKSLQLEAVFHAHIATGELHLRPVLNLKDPDDVLLFRKIAIETARLVKKYHGSLSGEHGDGRLRGEFIPFMLGNKVYEMLKALKKCWDPDQLFNPGKIIDTPPMHDWLRYQPGQETPELNAYFDYKLEQGLARSIEKCNGTADCRKSEIIGGTMCPSFMATRDEMHSTRGRANVLRELITRPADLHWADQHAVKLSLDLCLSCKACKSECPSGVDMARLKADFLQNHYDGNPVSLRTRLIAHYPALMKMAMKFNPLTNWVLGSKYLSAPLKLMIGFSVKRPMPHLSDQSLAHWMKKHVSENTAKQKVYLFNDEFLDVNESHIGIKTILLLEHLGYEVVIPKHVYSGRTFLSKGLVRRAQLLAQQNVRLLKEVVTDNSPLIGIEPSAILSFRDEYPDLVGEALKADAQQLAANTLMIDEFLVREFEAGRIQKDQFTTQALKIKLHGHCHQKALVSTDASVKMLQIPENYRVEEIPSGCCGMAGSFGYEKEHYQLSMQIGEMVLFPAVRQTTAEYRIAAPGTSCREQIAHGTGKKAQHPVEILFEALK
jgi:FAD/FMN-containing dehydrogenase/Fe-S oxidoreductase